MRKRSSRRTDKAGYSVVEMTVVMGVMAVVAGMAIVQINASRPGLKGDGAMRVVFGQFMQARELAITQRRYMRVVVTPPNLIQIVREDTVNTTTTISSVTLEGGVQFTLIGGLPDTPDGFGMGGAVDFGSAVNVKFAPDGTLVDQNGLLRNGSVFLAIPQTALSARAITVLGSTGRIRAYKWNGRAWTLV